MSGKVYIVQRPAFFCHERKGWVNKYDLSSAKDFGEIVVMLSPGNIYPDQIGVAIKTLEAILKDFSDEDHLLTVGDPIAAAAAVMVASDFNEGRVSLLKFDRKSNKYEPYLVELSELKD